jgi:hypothetical protein
MATKPCSLVYRNYIAEEFAAFVFRLNYVNMKTESFTIHSITFQKAVVLRTGHLNIFPDSVRD